MASEPRVFLDTSVLFTAVLSDSCGSRLILELGEASALHLQIGPQVLREADAVLTRKAPASKATFALLLDRCAVTVGSDPSEIAMEEAIVIVDQPGDARVLAEALDGEAGYFLTLDRRHFVDNPKVSALPFVVGTPGDFLDWFKWWVVTEQSL